MTSSRTPAIAHDLVISDAIHGDVTLSPFEAAIISTKEFQRLRRVRQLGFAHYVYPAAIHSRFEHSIGTSWMSKEICSYLTGEHPRARRRTLPKWIATLEASYAQARGVTSNPGKKRISIEQRQANSVLNSQDRLAWQQVVSAAALLHDITHIPFGHSLEDEVDEFKRHDDLESSRLYSIMYDATSELSGLFAEPQDWIQGIKNEVLRELIFLTLRFSERFEFETGFASSPNIRKYHTFGSLVDEAIEKKPTGGTLSALLETKRVLATHLGDGSSGMFLPFMADIVGNTICADLLDYLRRDSANCGLDERVHPRLLRALDVDVETSHSNMARVFVKLTDSRGGIRNDVVSDLQKLLTLRYNLASKVYYHPVKAAATRMLLKVLEIARDPELQALDDSHPFDEAYFLHTLISDDVIISDLVRYFALLKQKPQTTVRNTAQKKIESGLSLATALAERRLYKRFFSGRLSEGYDEVAVTRTIETFHDGETSQTERQSIEREIGDILVAGLNFDWSSRVSGSPVVLCYCPARKMQAKLATVRVSSGDRIVPLIQHTGLAFEQLQILHKQYHELWRVYLFAHPEVVDNTSIDRQRTERASDRARNIFGLSNEFAPRIGVPVDARALSVATVFEAARDCAALLDQAGPDLTHTREAIDRAILLVARQPDAVVKYWSKAAAGATLTDFSKQPESVRLAAYKALADALNQ